MYFQQLSAAPAMDCEAPHPRFGERLGANNLQFLYPSHSKTATTAIPDVVRMTKDQIVRVAILSAVIFNALVIIALIPLALRGVKYRAMSASSLLQRNLLIYGLGGIIVPFIGIKLIDMVVTAVGLA